MTTLTDALDSIVGSAFIPAEKTSSIVTALLYINGLVPDDTIIDGTSDNSDLAAAMFAGAILNNTKLYIKAQRDSNIMPKTLEEMWTQQMNDLLFKDLIIQPRISNKSPSSFAPGQRWQDGSSRFTG